MQSQDRNRHEQALGLCAGVCARQGGEGKRKDFSPQISIQCLVFSSVQQ